MQFLSEIGMAIYDETMAPGYARWRTVHPQLLDALVAYSGVQADSCVLEPGCGTGNYIRAISERTGCDSWGVDPSAAMLAQALVGVSRRSGTDLTVGFLRRRQERFREISLTIR